MFYTTISYFLLILFDLDLFFARDVVLDFSVTTFGLLNSAIIFSASFVPISLDVRLIFDLISSIIFSLPAIKKYCDFIKPDAICIDYEVDPIKIEKEINIPVQGGMDPKVLLTDKENIKKEATKYLDIFKDHPYIFNLGHGILPETKPEMMYYLVKFVKDY